MTGAIANQTVSSPTTLPAAAAVADPAFKTRLTEARAQAAATRLDLDRRATIAGTRAARAAMALAQTERAVLMKTGGTGCESSGSACAAPDLGVAEGPVTDAERMALERAAFDYVVANAEAAEIDNAGRDAAGTLHMLDANLRCLERGEHPPLPSRIAPRPSPLCPNETAALRLHRIFEQLDSYDAGFAAHLAEIKPINRALVGMPDPLPPAVAEQSFGHLLPELD